jgi:SAM-dependent methyltransferase
MSTTSNDYISINKNNWNKRAEAHMSSDFYNVEGFLNGASILNDIELELLGDIKGKSILHLQCHFGLDSLALARLGAKVVGVDFSEVAISKAKHLNERTNLGVEFICCNIYDLANHLNDTFDIVFTSYGTIGWLDNLDKWAQIIRLFLKPSGYFVFAEFHPFIWTFDNDLQRLTYDYFKGAPIFETLEGSYADTNKDHLYESVNWNYSLSEVFNCLQTADLLVTDFKEFDYSPYNCFSNLMAIAPQKFQFKHIPIRIPMVYALRAKPFRGETK